MTADRAKVLEALEAYRAMRKNMERYVEHVSRQLPLDQDWTDEQINDARMKCLAERLGIGEFTEGIRFPEDLLTRWDEMAHLSGLGYNQPRRGKRRRATGDLRFSHRRGSAREVARGHQRHGKVSDRDTHCGRGSTRPDWPRDAVSQPLAASLLISDNGREPGQDTGGTGKRDRDE